MNERLALLFSDGSLLVLPEETDVDAAWKEAEEHETKEENHDTEVVRLLITIIGRCNCEDLL